MIGYYYLHRESRDLIYKRDLGDTVADLRESDFVVAIWPFSPDRECGWSMLVEALAAGANKERVQSLAAKWGFNNEDAKNYAEAVGCCVATDSHPDDWFATRPDFKNIQESPNGWGSSALEAMAELAKELGYKPSKMWGHTFKSLLAQGAQ